MHGQAAFPVLIVLTALTTLFTACEKVPDYCGKGEWYNPDYQFCFNQRAYPLCSNGSYNPLTEGCDEDNLVATRCLGGGFVPPGTSCAGYTLTTAAAPAAGGGVLRFPDEPKYAAGQLVALSATAAEGYEFDGWTGALTSASATVAVTMDSNKPIVAMFKPKTPTLATTAFPPNGGTIESAVNGTQVTVTAEAAPGYTFSGWSGALTSTETTVTLTVNEGKTLVAIFTPAAYTLTVNANPATGGAVFVNGTASTGATPQNAGTQVEALAQPAAGYAFTGWSGAASGTDNPVMITISNSNRTLTANFERQEGGGATVTPTTYTLTVNTNPQNGGSASRSPDNSPSYAPGTYNAGATVTVTATAAQGYEFTGWTGASTSTNNSVEITMDGDKTLTAVFRSTSTTDPCATDSGSPACCAQTPGHPSCDTLPTRFTLTININPPGAGTVTPQSGSTYPQATSVELTASPAQGYTFIGWTGAINNPGNPASLTMISDRTVTANFQLSGGTDHCAGSGVGTPACCNPITGSNPSHPSCQSSNTYALSTSSIPAGSGTVTLNPPGGSYTAGTQVTATAQEASGYTFSYWTGASSASTKSVTIVMPAANTSLTANFQVSGGSFTIQISVNPVGAGTITLTPLKASYQNGDAVTVTANAYSNYTFVGWSGADNSTISPILLIMDGHKTLTANFQETTTDPCVLNPGSAECCAFNSSYPGCGGEDGVLVGDTLVYKGQRYRTVVIDGKRWMAENLNYAAVGSKCGGTDGRLKDENTVNCDTYGRLYDWATVMDGASSSSSIPSGVRGVCPVGWHLPSDAEWTALENSVGGFAGTKLKSKTGWYTGIGYKAGTDDVGFSALPGGYGYGGDFGYAGINGYWWSATEYDAGSAWYRRMHYNSEYVLRFDDGKADLFAARCAQDYSVER